MVKNTSYLQVYLYSELFCLFGNTMGTLFFLPVYFMYQLGSMFTFCTLLTSSFAKSQGLTEKNTLSDPSDDHISNRNFLSQI
jgi:hypothetical protein